MLFFLCEKFIQHRSFLNSPTFYFKFWFLRDLLVLVLTLLWIIPSLVPFWLMSYYFYFQPSPPESPASWLGSFFKRGLPLWLAFSASIFFSTWVSTTIGLNRGSKVVLRLFTISIKDFLSAGLTLGVCVMFINIRLLLEYNFEQSFALGGIPELSASKPSDDFLNFVSFLFLLSTVDWATIFFKLVIKFFPIYQPDLVAFTASLNREQNTIGINSAPKKRMKINVETITLGIKTLRELSLLPLWLYVYLHKSMLSKVTFFALIRKTSFLGLLKSTRDFFFFDSLLIVALLVNGPFFHLSIRMLKDIGAAQEIKTVPGIMVNSIKGMYYRFYLLFLLSNSRFKSYLYDLERARVAKKEDKDTDENKFAKRATFKGVPIRTIYWKYTFLELAPSDGLTKVDTENLKPLTVGRTLKTKLVSDLGFFLQRLLIAVLNPFTYVKMLKIIKHKYANDKDGANREIKYVLGFVWIEWPVFLSFILLNVLTLYQLPKNWILFQAYFSVPKEPKNLKIDPYSDSTFTLSGFNLTRHRYLFRNLGEITCLLGALFWTDLVTLFSLPMAVFSQEHRHIILKSRAELWFDCRARNNLILKDFFKSVRGSFVAIRCFFKRNDRWFQDIKKDILKEEEESFFQKAMQNRAFTSDMLDPLQVYQMKLDHRFFKTRDYKIMSLLGQFTKKSLYELFASFLSLLGYSSNFKAVRAMKEDYQTKVGNLWVQEKLDFLDAYISSLMLTTSQIGTSFLLSPLFWSLFWRYWTFKALLAHIQKDKVQEKESKKDNDTQNEGEEEKGPEKSKAGVSWKSQTKACLSLWLYCESLLVKDIFYRGWLYFFFRVGGTGDRKREEAQGYTQIMQGRWRVEEGDTKEVMKRYDRYLAFSTTLHWLSLLSLCPSSLMIWVCRDGGALIRGLIRIIDNTIIEGPKLDYFNNSRILQQIEKQIFEIGTRLILMPTRFLGFLISLFRGEVAQEATEPFVWGMIKKKGNFVEAAAELRMLFLARKESFNNEVMPGTTEEELQIRQAFERLTDKRSHPFMEKLQNSLQKALKTDYWMLFNAIVTLFDPIRYDYFAKIAQIHARQFRLYFDKNTTLAFVDNNLMEEIYSLTNQQNKNIKNDFNAFILVFVILLGVYRVKEAWRSIKPHIQKNWDEFWMTKVWRAIFKKTSSKSIKGELHFDASSPYNPNQHGLFAGLDATIQTKLGQFLTMGDKANLLKINKQTRSHFLRSSFLWLLDIQKMENQKELKPNEVNPVEHSSEERIKASLKLYSEQLNQKEHIFEDSGLTISLILRREAYKSLIMLPLLMTFPFHLWGLFLDKIRWREWGFPSSQQIWVRYNQQANEEFQRWNDGLRDSDTPEYLFSIGSGHLIDSWDLKYFETSYWRENKHDSAKNLSFWKTRAIALEFFISGLNWSHILFFTTFYSIEYKFLRSRVFVQVNSAANLWLATKKGFYDCLRGGLYLGAFYIFLMIKLWLLRKYPGLALGYMAYWIFRFFISSGSIHPILRQASFQPHLLLTGPLYLITMPLRTFIAHFLKFYLSKLTSFLRESAKSLRRLTKALISFPVSVYTWPIRASTSYCLKGPYYLELIHLVFCLLWILSPVCIGYMMVGWLGGLIGGGLAAIKVFYVIRVVRRVSGYKHRGG